jgi:diguanylate cyclase (GGDEF)-like protein/PAS domain S-box-containing protein
MLAAGLSGLGLYLVFNQQNERERLEASERDRLITQSKVIEQNLSRQLVAIDLAITSIVGNLPYWAGLPDGQKQAVRQLKSLEDSMPSVRTFLVLNAQGDVILSNRDELMQRNFSQREYFQAPLRSLNPRVLFVSPPFKSVLNTYLFNLTHVVLDVQGKFAGVVSVGVDPVDIEILLNSVRYADDMRSMLVHGDGKVFVVEPPTPELLGKDLSAADSFFSQHLANKHTVSTFKGTAYSSGDERLPALRTIQPAALQMDKPLVIAVSRHLPTLFSHLQKDAINQFLGYLMLVLLSGIATWWYQMGRTRQRLSAQRLKLATEAAGVGIWEFDLKTKRYHWDASMFELFGLDPNKVNLNNDDWLQLTLPGELERIKNATRVAIDQNQPFDLTFKILRPDGEVRYMRNRAALFGESQANSSRMIGTTEDVTERKMKEADLRIAAIAFNCQEGMVVTDASMNILRVNRAFSDLFGYSSEEAIGQTPRVLQSGRHDQAFYQVMWADIIGKGVWQGEVWNRRKNGEVFPEWLTITAVYDSAGAVTHYVATHIDITLRKAAEDEIRHLAFYDPLTHLPNRRLLRDRLQHAMAQAKRDGTQLGLMFVDLDKFKPVNDQHGHAVGDQLLQAVAHRLSTCVRESDTVARVGGDEFVVLLSMITGALDAVLVAEKVHSVLQQVFILPDGAHVNISSSAGIAIYPEHGTTEAELTLCADAAMYQAKAAGRDRFVVFDGTSLQSAEANLT